MTDAGDLHVHLCDRSVKEQFHRRKRESIEKLAHLIRKFHERFLLQRDLKAANILVSESLDSSDVDFTFIDLVGVRSARSSSRQRIQNLARLDASFLANPLITRTDKLRFLRTYLCWGLRGRANWKEWWIQVTQATQCKQVRNARRGRPLS